MMRWAIRESVFIGVWRLRIRAENPSGIIWKLGSVPSVLRMPEGTSGVERPWSFRRPHERAFAVAELFAVGAFEGQEV